MPFRCFSSDYVKWLSQSRKFHGTKSAALWVQYDYLLSNGRNPLNELLLLIEEQLQRQPRMHFWIASIQFAEAKLRRYFDGIFVKNNFQVRSLFAREIYKSQVLSWVYTDSSFRKNMIWWKRSITTRCGETLTQLVVFQKFPNKVIIYFFGIKLLIQLLTLLL